MTTPTTTTGTTAATRAVGTAHTRVEGRAKVTGAARYAGEIPYAELAHGWLVLSTVARGRIRSVEDTSVLGMPGVLTVLHHANAPRLDGNYMNGFGPPDPVLQLFQHDRVPFVGWPVALVVAETPEQAREAAEALVVQYDEEPYDVAFFAGRPGMYTPEDSETAKGDLESELAASAVVVDAEYTTPEEHHSPMEPHAATARWDSGRLRGRRLQPGQRVRGRRARETVLARPGLGARAVRTRRRRLRGQGDPPALGPRRDGGDRSAPPGAGRTDPPSDVLARRLPQPHGAACQARGRHRRAAARVRPPGGVVDLDRP